MMANSSDEIGRASDGPRNYTHDSNVLSTFISVLGRLGGRPRANARKNPLKSMLGRWTALDPYGEALAVQARAPASRRVVNEKTKCPFFATPCGST